MHSTIHRYFALEGDRDLDGLLALFADDATVVDEGRTRQGKDAIRAWRAEVASRYTFTTEVRAITDHAPDRARVEGRITGDFPGGVADLAWEFTIAGDRIRRLVIAP
jgi:uncharacterized protein (TIGR02246 family)